MHPEIHSAVVVVCRRIGETMHRRVGWGVQGTIREGVQEMAHKGGWETTREGVAGMPQRDGDPQGAWRMAHASGWVVEVGVHYPMQVEWG